MKILNSKGRVYYGMHFYPGVAEYRDAPNLEPYRIFINEDTIRSMDPTFAARPIYVEHVDEVETDINKLREVADGWVVESFYNSADGKHWVKFIVVSDRAERAISNGYRLSNAYHPKSFGNGGLWNGVGYLKEVTSGEYEHLAIVKNPRYEESVIMTPEQFKVYNAEKEKELLRLANSKEEKPKMKLNLFKRTKVENSTDFDGMIVSLPKSGQEIALTKLVNDADEMAMMDSKEMMANGDHKVMVGEEKMSVNDLLAKHKAMNDELDLLKEKKPADKSGAKNPDIKSMDNDDEDEAAKKKALELAEHEEKEILEEKSVKKENEEKDEDKKENEDSEDEEKSKEEKKKNAADEAAKKAESKKHFDTLKNAPRLAAQETVKIDLSEDRVARGKTRYGSV